MAASKLTAKTLEAAKPSEHVYRIRDTIVPGFHLTVTPAGSKSFAFQYSSPERKGERRFYPLGVYKTAGQGREDKPITTLEKARSAALRLREAVTGGVDPLEEDERKNVAKRKAQEEAQTGTVGQLFDLYVSDLSMDGKRSADQIGKAFSYDCEHLRPLKAADITKDDIADIIATVSERAPIQANRLRTYLHACFAFGLNCGSMPRWRKTAPDFRLTHNPVTLTKRATVEKPGDRFLSKDEVKALWNSIGVDALSADLAVALKLLLATGQRVEEVLHAEWSEFDEEEKLWTIPAGRRKTRGKVNEPHIVPLTKLHIRLLKELKQYSGDSRYLFPKTRKEGAPEQPRGADALSQAVHRFCRPGEQSTRKPFPPFVPKDIRRTWKTLAGSIGISLELRNRIQGHALRDVGSVHYDRWDYLEEKRRTMGAWCRWLDELVTGKKRGKVVNLRGGAA